MNELMEKDDTFDKIEKYYRNSGTLSIKEQEICERWEIAFSVLCAQRNKKVAVSKFMALMKSKGVEVSLATAYRDFEAAEKLYTPLRKYSKEFLRLVLIESAMRDVKKAEELAGKTKDPKQWAEIMKVKDKAEKRIIEAGGLSVDDPNLPDFSKLQANVFNINIDHNIMNMFKALVKRGSVDITEIYTNLQNGTEDITYMEDGTEES